MITDYYYTVIMPVWAAFIMCLIFFVLWRRHGKLEVRIKTPHMETSKWVKPEADGKTVILQKDTKKKPEWKLSFEQTQRRKDLFGSHLFIETHYQSNDAFVIDWKQKTVDRPQLTKQQVKDFATWEGLKARYQTIEKPKTSMLMIIIAVICILILVLMLRSSGFIRI